MEDVTIKLADVVRDYISQDTIRQAILTELTGNPNAETYLMRIESVPVIADNSEELFGLYIRVLPAILQSQCLSRTMGDYTATIVVSLRKQLEPRAANEWKELGNAGYTLYKKLEQIQAYLDAHTPEGVARVSLLGVQTDSLYSGDSMVDQSTYDTCIVLTVKYIERRL